MTTSAGYMFSHFTLLQYLEFLARILVSCFCGACIGFERTKRLKEAGIRTHIIVSCASALTMIISKYGFADMTSAAGFFTETLKADPARLAAQVVCGVSFLGAGIIFRNGNSVRGLTTAAGIWATAAIGLAIGSGMYVIGLAGTLIIAAIQIIMHRFTIGTDSMMVGTISCQTKQPELFRKALDEYVARNRMQILATKVRTHDDGSESYQFTLRMHVDTTVNDLLQFLESVEDTKAISCEIEK